MVSKLFLTSSFYDIRIVQRQETKVKKDSGANFSKEATNKLTAVSRFM